MTDHRRISIAGAALRCQHCDFDHFGHRKAQLNTAAMTFMDLDWLNASADVYVCGRCGHLHWFLPPPPPETRAIADDTSVAGDCLSCGGVIPPGSNECASCGWSYA